MALRAPDAPPPRYSGLALPPYRYVAGHTPHPTRDPSGHAFGVERNARSTFDPKTWRSSREYLHAIDLFNHGFWWEAHEALEDLWRAVGRRSDTGVFLQGLIQIAAAHWKHRAGSKAGATRLCRAGLSKLRRASGVRLGIDVAALAAQAEAYFSGARAAPARILLVGSAPDSAWESRRAAGILAAVPDSLASGPCSLTDPRVRGVLERLHREAAGQKAAIARFGLSMLTDRLLGRKTTPAREAERARNLYLAISAKQGAFVYLVARSLGARRVVEFGTSFGISTLYLAAAVRDNGGGIVIGSELEPQKIAVARANLEEAGLDDQLEIREGDACQTLKDPGGPVDMALLDGWKDLYLPVLEILTPHLRTGAVVLGDNIFTFWKSLAPYRAHVRDESNGFQSVTLHLGDGTEYSVRL